MEQHISLIIVNKPPKMVKFNQQEILLTNILAQTIFISNRVVQAVLRQELDLRKCTLNQLPAFSNHMEYPCS